MDDCISKPCKNNCGRKTTSDYCAYCDLMYGFSKKNLEAAKRIIKKVEKENKNDN